MKRIRAILRYVIHYDHWIVTSMAIVFTFVLAMAFNAMQLKNPYQKSVSANSLTEMYHRYITSDRRESHSANVTVVDIGDLASRTAISRLINQIDSFSPIAIGIDIVFASPSEQEVDSVLVNTFANLRSPLVMGQIKQSDGTMVKSFFSDELSLRSGMLMLDTDGGVIHTFRAIQDGDSSFVAYLNTLWNNHYGIKEQFSLTEQPITVDYGYNCHIVAADSALQYPEYIENTIVIVGDASSGSDEHNVPTHDGKMSGPEIHAMCLYTLHGMDQYPHEIPMWVNLLLAFVLAYVMEVLLSLVQTRLPDVKKPWAVFIKEWVKNSYLTNIVLLPLLTVITILMMNATMHGRLYQLTIIFTAVVLVVECRNIYKAAINALRVKYNWKILKNSLI